MDPDSRQSLYIYIYVCIRMRMYVYVYTALKMDSRFRCFSIP